MADNEETIGGSNHAEFFNELLTMVRENKHVVVEVFVCPKCNNESLMGHLYQEAMTCQHCGQHLASAAPRVPSPGEVTLEHVVLAMETLGDCYEKSAANILPAVSKWAELGPEVQLIVTQVSTRLVVAALKQVNSLAIALAEGKK